MSKTENHHATAAQNLVQQDKSWTVGWETADAQHLATHIEAQAEATLALAYEQRTANLIAVLVAGQSVVQVAGVDYNLVANEISERLALS